MERRCVVGWCRSPSSQRQVSGEAGSPGGQLQSWGSGAQEQVHGVLAHRCFPGCLPSRALAMRKGKARAGMRKLVSVSSPPGSAGLQLPLSRPGVRAPPLLNNFSDTHWGEGARDACF